MGKAGTRARQAGLGVAGGVLCILCAGGVQAQEAEGPAWLEWSAPPECPPKSSINARVSEWLGGPLVERDELAVVVDLSWHTSAWHVVMDINYQGHHGQRRVMVPSCQDAADFVAVAVVLTVDPHLAGQIPAPSTVPIQAESSAEEDNTAMSGSTGSSPGPAPVQPEVPPKVERRMTHGHITLEAEGSYGPLPGFRPGMALGLGLDIGKHVLMANVRWLPGLDEATVQAAEPVSFGLIAGRVAWAYLVLSGRYSIGPVLSVSVGAIRTRQGQDAPHAELWGAVGGGGTALVRLIPSMALVGEFELEVPWTRPSFVLSDGSVVHEVSLGTRVALGLRFFFPNE